MSLFSSLGKYKYIIEQHKESQDDSPLNTLKHLLCNGDNYDSTKQHNTLKELGKIYFKFDIFIFKD